MFPLLMPTTLFVLINAVLNSFKLVDHLFVLTKGGPNNASNLLLYYIFETAFSYFETHLRPPLRSSCWFCWGPWPCSNFLSWTNGCTTDEDIAIHFAGLSDLA